MSLRVEKLLSDLRSAAEKATPSRTLSLDGDNTRYALVDTNELLVLCELAQAAKELAELANVISVWMHTSGLQMPAQVDEDSYNLGDKARAFLEKFFPKGET